MGTTMLDADKPNSSRLSYSKQQKTSAAKLHRIKKSVNFNEYTYNTIKLMSPISPFSGSHCHSNISSRLHNFVKGVEVLIRIFTVF